MRRKLLFLWAAIGLAASMMAQTTTTALQDKYRGATMATAADTLRCDPLQGATAYKMRMTRASDNAVLTDSSGTTAFVPGKLGLKFSDSYAVSIATLSGTTWGAYGPAYTVTTPAAPLTRLGAQYHNKQLSSWDTLVVAIKMPGATLYLFEFADPATGDRFRHYNRGNSIRVADVKGLQPNKTYLVRVLPRFHNTLSLFSVAARVIAPKADRPLDKTLTITVNGVAMTLCLIPAGTFTMGSPETEVSRYSNETQHSVTISNNFYMGKTEVTQELWTAVMGSNPSHFNTCPTCPVELVSWDDCQVFIATLNQLTGKTFALPTEAQWEYAARAGSTTPFNTGGCLTNLQANYNWSYPYSGCTNSVTTSPGKTTPAGSYPANAWGLQDMHGNVWEWCADWFQNDLGTLAVTDPTGPATGSYRVNRGGGWGSNGQRCRSAVRGNDYPAGRYIIIGLRVVLVP